MKKILMIFMMFLSCCFCMAQEVKSGKKENSQMEIGPSAPKISYVMTLHVKCSVANSPYAWLNDAIFVCTPFFEKDTIGLKVWKVN